MTPDEIRDMIAKNDTPRLEKIKTLSGKIEKLVTEMMEEVNALVDPASLHNYPNQLGITAGALGHHCQTTIDKLAPPKKEPAA